MGVQIAVGRTEFREPLRQHQVVPGLVVADRDPVVEKGTGKILMREPGEDIESEIDGVQLDMGQRVEQCDAALRARRNSSARHLARRAQGRVCGPGRSVGRRHVADRHGWVVAPGLRRVVRGQRLCVRIGG